MKITDAIMIIEEELDKSHERCHYPYVMTCGSASIGEPPDVRAGTYVMINSDVFGRIAGASEATFAEALKVVAMDLVGTRKVRWSKERNKMKQKK